MIQTARRSRRKQRRPLLVENLETRRMLTADIEGFVWHDVDRDGYRAKPSREFRVADIAVILLDDANIEVAKTSTDEDGVYRFSNVLPGRYSMEFIATDGASFTRPNIDDDNKDSDVDPVTGRTHEFDVRHREEIDNLDAGLYAESGTDTVRGRIWQDVDGDGLMDEDESGLRGSLVQLENVHGEKLIETESDGDGFFEMSGNLLLPGEYQLDFIRPSSQDDSWDISPRRVVGNTVNARDSDADILNGKTESFLLPVLDDISQRNSVEYSAGFFQEAKISGKVFYNIQDANEEVLESYGVESFQVRLLNPEGDEIDSTKTNLNGDYSFILPQPGNYSVHFVTPEGVSLRRHQSVELDWKTGITDRIEVSARTHVNGVSAHVYPTLGTQSIYGHVWHDLNADGIQDPDEPGIAGAEVQIENQGLKKLLEATTDASGSYLINGAHLFPGTYHLDFKRPPRSGEQRWHISPRSMTEVDQLNDNDAQPTNGKSPPIHLQAYSTTNPLPVEGRTALRRNGAFFYFGQTQGKVWDDINANGIQDDGEVPLPGVRVDLLGPKDDRLSFALTDASGRYSFDDLLPGLPHQIKISPPENTRLTAHTDLTDPKIESRMINADTGLSSTYSVSSHGLVNVSAGIAASTDQTLLEGRAWSDTNGNGIQDEGESGQAGVGVTVLDLSHKSIARTKTDAEGTFQFLGLTSGGYTLRFDLPDGSLISPIHRGDDSDRDSDANPFSKRTGVITIATGQHEPTFDVGIYSGPLSTNVMDSLRISEVGFIGHGNAEFAEVKNIGTEPVDLTGVAFTKGVRFRFSDNDALFPGEHAIVVGDQNTLNKRFDLETINIAGKYRGDLNREEKITLVDRDGEIVTSFRYDDDWFILMDDEYEAWTLTVVDELADVSAWNSRRNWRPSSILAGTPGSDDPKTTPDPGAVVINEVLSKSSGGFNDLVEIYNTTDQDIDISYWYLSDSSDQGEVEPLIQRTRYSISPGTILPAKGYLVFSREEHFGNPADPGLNYPFGVSSFGEAVHIIGADPYGKMLGYSDSATLTAAEPDMAFGRVLLSDGSDLFTALKAPTFGSANTQPTFGPPVIDAVFYQADSSTDEFVRLYNPTLKPFQLENEGDAWGLGEGIRYRFEENEEIPARGHLIVSSINPDEFRTKYAVPTHVPVVGPFDGSLENRGESISLYRPGLDERQLVVDRVTYSSHTPWPVLGETGIPLQRMTTSVLGDEPSNWRIASSLDSVLQPEPPKPNGHLDVNQDESISPIDALIVINSLNGVSAIDPAKMDVNGDGDVSPLDPLIIINFLNEETNTAATAVRRATTDRGVTGNPHDQLQAPTTISELGFAIECVRANDEVISQWKIQKTAVLEEHCQDAALTKPWRVFLDEWFEI